MAKATKLAGIAAVGILATASLAGCAEGNHLRAGATQTSATTCEAESHAGLNSNKIASQTQDLVPPTLEVADLHAMSGRQIESTIVSGAAAKLSTPAPAGNPDVVSAQPLHNGDIAYLDLYVFDAKTGKVLPQISATGQAYLIQEDNPVLSQLLCAKPGDRVSTVFAPELANEIFGGVAGAQESPRIMVAEVVSHGQNKASGTTHALPSGFPDVTRNDKGQPGVVIPPQPIGSELRAAARITGTGAKVAENSDVILNVMQVSWQGEILGNTFDSSPIRAEGSLPTQIRTALNGFPVGSQVVIIAPAAADAREDSVFVIDILAAN